MATLTRQTSAARRTPSRNVRARPAAAMATQTSPIPETYFTSAPSVKAAPERTGPRVERGPLPSSRRTASRLKLTINASLCASPASSNSSSGFQAKAARAATRCC